MAIKDDYIKIRVSKEQKALFKDIAKKKNISMSKFIIVSTEERALREKKKNLRVQIAWSLELVSLRRNYKRLNLKWRAKKPRKKVF